MIYLFFFRIFREEHEKIRCIQTTIDGTKKEALKLMEQNETLEEFKQRLQQDLSHSNKQCMLHWKKQNPF